MVSVMLAGGINNASITCKTPFEDGMSKTVTLAGALIPCRTVTLNPAEPELELVRLLGLVELVELLMLLVMLKTRTWEFEFKFELFDVPLPAPIVVSLF